MITSHDCFQCGSKLLEVTKTMSGSAFPITVTIYKCSKDSCQKENDERVSAAHQRIKDHEEAKRLRQEAKQKINLPKTL